MSNRQDWWNRFWGERPARDVPIEKDPETWDEFVWAVAFESWGRLFDRFAPGKSMLECGCGSARISQYMARRGYVCTLLDSSPDGLGAGQENFRRNALDGRFVVGDVSDLCFRDGRFDVVYSGGMLEFLDDIEHPIREMVRVLRPGGVFAANIVPAKFSIQSLANVERTAAHAIQNLIRGDVRSAFRYRPFIPPDYRLNEARLKDYVSACEKAGLVSLAGLGTSPFPQLALPSTGVRLYARMMKALLPQWRRFNESKGRWTEVWGITYTLYGIKAGGERGSCA
jgi:SAM-dependent methyltransferase